MNKSWDRIKILHEMSCGKDFSPLLCTECQYYYITPTDKYKIASCLKNNILNWTLYQMER